MIRTTGMGRRPHAARWLGLAVLGLLVLAGCNNAEGSEGSPGVDPRSLDLGFRNSEFTPDSWPPQSASEVLGWASGARQDSGLAPTACASWWLADNLVMPEDRNSDDTVGGIGVLRASDPVGAGGTSVGMTYREFDDFLAAQEFLTFVSSSAKRCPDGFVYTQTSSAWGSEVSDEVGTAALEVTRGEGPGGGTWVLVDEQGVEAFYGDYTTYDDHYWHYFFAYGNVVIEFLNPENDRDSNALLPTDRDALFAQAVQQFQGRPRSSHPENPAFSPTPIGDRPLALEDLIGLRIGGDYAPNRGPSRNIYWEPAFYRWASLDSEDPLAVDFPCRDLVLATKLLRPEDTGHETTDGWAERDDRDRIVVLDEARLRYPHVLRQLSARQFSSSSEAEAFIQLIRDSIELCRGGYEIPPVGDFPETIPAADIEVLDNPDVGDVTVIRQPTREWRDAHQQEAYDEAIPEETYYFAQVENLVVLYSMNSGSWVESEATAEDVFAAVAARLDREGRIPVAEVEPDFYFTEDAFPYSGHYWLYQLAEGFRPWLAGHYFDPSEAESTAAATLAGMSVPSECGMVWTSAALVSPGDGASADPIRAIGDLVAYDEDAHSWDEKRTFQVRAREFDNESSAKAFVDEVAADGHACSGGTTVKGDETSIDRVTVVSPPGRSGRDSVSLIREQVVRIDPDTGYPERLRAWNTHFIAYGNIVVAFDYVDDYAAVSVDPDAVDGLFKQVIAYLHWNHRPYWSPDSL